MKKIIAVIFVMFLCLSLAACDTTGLSNDTDTKKDYKIGMAFYGLSNPIWAEEVETAVAYGKELGIEVSYVDAGTDAENQIAQIENYIQSGVDAIVVLSIDTTALENVTNKAKEKGIRIIDFTRELATADTSITLDCEENARALVEMTVDWVKENMDLEEKVEWAFLNIPTVQLGVEEGMYTEQFMKELLPEAELVARGATLTVEEGIENTENFLQAHPDLRVIISLGAGGGVGGNEAIKSAVKEGNYNKYGLFSIDATEQELLNIINGDPQKGTISLGSAKEIGRLMIDVALETLESEDFDSQYYLPITKVANKDDAQKHYDESYKK